jgi:hypothetical protein
MNKISRSDARRYRALHILLFSCIPLGFLGLALPSVLPSPDSTWVILAPAVWFFGFLTLGLLGLWFLERRILRVVAPDPETRRRVVALSWFRPFGTFIAVNELLRLAVEK